MTNHVKIHGIIPRIQYTANGTLSTFTFPFAIFAEDNIEVYLDNTKQSDTTYSVSGVRDSEGGSVTFTTAPTSGTIVTIVRNLSIERTSDFQEGGALRADTLNDEFDYQIACQQQIADNLNRAMTLPPYATNTDVDFTIPTPDPGKAFVWSADGKKLENSTVAVNALESTLKGYKIAAETAASTATTKASAASDKADIATAQAETATTQAGIATAKAEEAASTLSNTANKDLDNISNTGQAVICALPLPNYSAGISESGTSFTAPSDGWVYIVRNAPQNSYLRGSIDGVQISYNAQRFSTACDISDLIPISKDSIFETASGTSITFFPCKGV